MSPGGGTHDWSGVGQRLRAALASGVGRLGEKELRGVFAGTAIRFGPAAEAATPAEAAALASELGFPVVVKALPSGILHKTELGLVRIGLESAGAVDAAAAELLEAARGAGGDAKPALSVQKQLRGIELAIGARRDALGALCMVAAGGVLIELIQDRAVALAPLDRWQAEEMVRSLRVARLLRGYRGSEPVDVTPLVDLLVAVAGLVTSVPEIADLDLNPVFVGADGCLVADAALVLRDPAPSEPEPPPGAESLLGMMRARRIAIIGSTGGPLKVGSLLLRYLRKHGYPGDLVVVNPNGGEIGDIATYRSLREVPGRVDLACIAAPTAAVPGIVEDCVEAGIPAGVIYSSGFAEAGVEGARLQAEVTRRAQGRFRFVGPNSIGIASVWDHMFATFGMALESSVDPGSIGFISQSGAIASSLLSRAPEFGVSFSRWMSVGNEADLGVADCLESLIDDVHTRAICMFLEVIRRPEAFRRACARALEARKPVIAVKTGRSEAGREAAASHTASLAGSDLAYDAFLRSCGVLRVDDLRHLFATARALVAAGPVSGNRVALITMSGGIASLLADACADAGLDLPTVGEETQRRLREVLPNFAGIRNPVDVTAVGISRPELIGKTLDVVRSSGEFDLVLVQFTTNADPGAEQMARDLIAAREEPGPPFLVGRLGSRRLAPAAMRSYERAGMHVFDWPDQLVQAAAGCVRYGRYLRDRPLALEEVR